MTASAMPARAGIGLRAPHAAAIQATRPALGFLEVHAENYLAAGPQIDRLLQLRGTYPVSLHGVGLSLGSAEGIDREHLDRVAALAATVEPMLVSEHLSWSIVEGAYLNDLLPLPYTDEALDIVARNIDIVQEALGRQILMENPSRYLRFRHSPIPEPEFLTALVKRSGCGILCDINNIYVSSKNCREDALAYLQALPRHAVHEYHLAGHASRLQNGGQILIDDHGSPVCADVWALYRAGLRLLGPAATLIEWDKNLPELTVLLAEARHAEREAAHALSVDALAS
jgi:uncharacterized protein